LGAPAYPAPLGGGSDTVISDSREGSGEQEAGLEQDDQRHHLDQHADRVRPREEHREDRQCEVGVAPVGRQLLRGDDAEPGDGQDPDRQLEEKAHHPERQGEEAVVVARPHLDVELRVVEVQEELGGGRQDDEVAEDDPGDEQNRHQDQERDNHPPLPVRQGGEDEGVGLIEDHRQRDNQRRVGRDRHGGGERLGDAEGDRVPIAGKRGVGDVEQVVVLPEAEREGHHEGGYRDDDPRAELVEVFDEREPVLEVDRPEPGHG
jgi:hypothetical protein